MDQPHLSDAERADLLAMTGLPTAAGREGRVVAWVERWAGQRAGVELHRDRFGNLMLQREGAGGAGRLEEADRRPIVLAAHMDHPAFVLTSLAEGELVEADFRGGVADNYFHAAGVRVHHTAGDQSVTGRVVTFTRNEHGDGRATLRLEEEVSVVQRVEAGDVATWDLPEPRVVDGHLYAPACDDLAGVAGALAAMDRWLTSQERDEGGGGRGGRGGGDLRVLLTRAEEVGFIGAIAACESGIIPSGSRIVALENSKSFAESPIGGGPIVRVGDRTSTFDPGLTYAVSAVAAELAKADEGFTYQRRLMPGGTCEATAYQTLGHVATCVCLPLGRYHNMNEATGRIDSEMISLADYAGLVRLLVAVAQRLDDEAATPTLATRLRERFDRVRGILQE